MAKKDKPKKVVAAVEEVEEVEEADEAPPAPVASAAAPGEKRFAKLAQVKVADLLSFNSVTGIGVTKFGGKYQMNKAGTELKHMAGPVPQGVVSDAEQKEQERLEREANKE